MYVCMYVCMRTDEDRLELNIDILHISFSNINLPWHLSALYWIIGLFFFESAKVCTCIQCKYLLLLQE